MANPSPQHTPTDGLGTATQIIVSGSGVNTIVPGRQYSISLNVSGSPNPAFVSLSGAVKDLGGNAFSSGNSNTLQWVSYNPNIVSIVQFSGIVSAITPGVVIVEAQFHSFDNKEGTDPSTGNLKDMIYAQVIVTVGT